MPDLNLTSNLKYSRLLYFQGREVFSINITTISVHENHQPIQSWNPTTTIEIKILKMIFIGPQKYNENNNK